MNSTTVRVLGTTDEYLVCELCGRADLKSTVVLDIDGEIVHYGSDCASRVVAMPAADIDKAARAADREAAAQAEIARQAAATAASNVWFAWLVDVTGTADVAEAIASLGGFSAARARFAQEG